MHARIGMLLVSLLVPVSNGSEHCDGKEDAKNAVAEYEQVALKWIAAFGTPDEKARYEEMQAQRDLVIASETAAIEHLIPLLKHEKVNLRRGTAIALFYIIENNAVDDRKLLDALLLRMIEDEDIKTRSNLYHAVSALIRNLTGKEESEPKAINRNPAPVCLSGMVAAVAAI